MRSSLRAKRSNPPTPAGRGGLLPFSFSELRRRSRRFAFVAGNDEGTNRAMTAGSGAPLAPKPLRKHLFQDLPLDAPVGQRSIVPPPAIALHLLGGRDKAVGHLSEV